jgi:type IV secretion system protein VirD4
MPDRTRQKRPAPLAYGLILGRLSPPARIQVGFAAPQKAGRLQPSESDDSLITYRGDGHVITVAPTGTGKTAGSVICNALNHPGQLIVIDIKGDVYRATARRRREMGQKVHLLDLRDGEKAAPSDALNPLDLARMCGSDLAAVARSFAAEFIDRTGRERDRFWNDWAETLIAAGAIWQLNDHPAGTGTMSGFHDLLTRDDPDYKIATMLDNAAFSHPAAHAGFASYLQLPERETRPSVLGTVLQHLRFFDSRLVREATDTTTIDLAALVAGEPMTLYITVPPMRLSAFRPLLRCWLTGLLFLLTQRTRLPEHRTLMLCDEIGNLGRIDAFLTASTLLRGWGLTLWSFWQNIAQLEIYGDQARTIVDNAGVLQFFGARNRRMAEDFAALVGGIDADTIMAMRGGEQMLLVDGALVENSRTLRYYSEPMFAGLYDEGPMPGR